MNGALQLPLVVPGGLLHKEELQENQCTRDLMEVFHLLRLRAKYLPFMMAHTASVVIFKSMGGTCNLSPTPQEWQTPLRGALLDGG